MYPLQILSAMVNQIRKLLLVKDFTRRENGRAWRVDVSFGRFKSHVLPDLMAHDKNLLDRIALWETSFLKENHDDGAPSGPKDRQSRTVSDLTLVKNPNNPYPVYQSLKNSENFTEEELFSATARLSRADVMLKSTSHRPKRVLEDVIFAICGKPERHGLY
jgi:DNA polymerase-3 subunit delta